MFVWIAGKCLDDVVDYRLLSLYIDLQGTDTIVLSSRTYRVALVDSDRPREFVIAPTKRLDRKKIAEEAPWFL